MKTDTQTHCVRDNGEWWGVWQTEGQKPYRRGTGITQLLVTGVLWECRALITRSNFMWILLIFKMLMTISKQNKIIYRSIKHIFGPNFAHGPLVLKFILDFWLSFRCISNYSYDTFIKCLKVILLNMSNQSSYYVLLNFPISGNGIIISLAIYLHHLLSIPSCNPKHQ